ncbi:maleylpyruvate isomerase family mycothiol-dependent enzyme [Actinopolymorpha sp. NPDC004070]|uniref:maleylpyruvate isomerase family mycothiol-dependent enzyme n=1 Tax=Actinopolymorpha sp. NPDC004070 TaxID=3154548 RepID=UPI0033BF95B9
MNDTVRPESAAGTESATQLYDASTARIAALVRDADPSTPVDACPGWTVEQLVAHLAGGLGDFLARRFDLAPGDDFGERTVRERRGQAVAESLAEWERHRAEAGDLLASPMGGVLVAEVVSHEQDLRTALGRPGARTDPGVRVGLTRPLEQIDQRLRESGGPAVRLMIDDEKEHRTIGEGEPVATLRVSAYDLLRTIGGRRTHDQARALDWDGDAEAALDSLTLFGSFRDTPLRGE